jgi:outer membrane protein assembly factor BamB
MSPLLAPFILIFIVIFTVSLSATPVSSLQDKKNNIRWPLKWSTLIGLTTFRTTIHHVNDQIVIGSNGNSYSSYYDVLDGVYFIDSKTGKRRHHIQLLTPGDRDVNGVAVTAQRIFFGNDNNQFFAYDWNKNMIWTIPLNGDLEGAPALEDFNSDGVMDVVIGTESGQLLTLDGKNGHVLWQFQAKLKPSWTHPKTNAFIASPSIIDIDSDGIRDVLIGNRNGDFYAFNGKTGHLLWSFRTQKPSGIHSSVFATSSTLYFTESYGYVYVYSKKGHKRLQLPVTPESLPILKASPVETPKGTIVIPTTWKGKKTGVWLYPRHTPPKFIPLGNVSASPIIADFLGNGSFQIGVLSENGWFIIISEEGDVLARFSLNEGGEATPFITDVDGNGTLDLILATSDHYLACYDTGSTGAVYWNGFRGNPYNTGVVTDTIDEDFPISNTRSLIIPKKEKSGYHYRPLYQENFANTPHKIDHTGIGPVKLGLTMGKLVQILGDDVDYHDMTLGMGLKARAILWNNEIQLYILYPEWKPLDKTHVIKLLVTDNPNYHTSNGISPQSTIADAVHHYGPARLTFQLENAAEERILFKKNDTKIWFSNYGKEKQGVYPTFKKFNITKRYQKDATIGFIGVKQ